VAYLGFANEARQTRVARAYNGGLRVEPRSPNYTWVQKQSPWSGGQGDSPLRLKLWLLDIQRKPQICPLFRNLEKQNITDRLFVLSRKMKFNQE